MSLVRPDADCHGVRREPPTALADGFTIEHTTLQVDHETRGGLLDIEPAPSPATQGME